MLMSVMMAPVRVSVTGLKLVPFQPYMMETLLLLAAKAVEASKINSTMVIFTIPPRYNLFLVIFIIFYPVLARCAWTIFTRANNLSSLATILTSATAAGTIISVVVCSSDPARMCISTICRDAVGEAQMVARELRLLALVKI